MKKGKKYTEAAKLIDRTMPSGSAEEIWSGCMEAGA